MRKITLLFFTLIIIAACSQIDLQEPPINNTNNELCTISQIRTPEEAIAIAIEASSLLDDQTSTHSRNSIRTIDYKESAITITHSPQSRSQYSNATSDTLIYIVNYANNQGFAIIAADKEQEAILGVTEKGHFDNEDNIKSPEFRMFLNSAKLYAAGTAVFDSTKITITRPGAGGGDIGGGGTNFTETKTVIDTIKKKTVKPSVTVKWGQSGFYGALFSNHYCGCANLAIAQAMSVLEFPTLLSLTYQGPLPTGIARIKNLNWSLIKKHIQGDCSGESQCAYCGDNQAYTHNIISELLREIAEYGGMHMTEYATSSYLPEVKLALKHFDIPYQGEYDFDTEAFWNYNANVTLICGCTETTGHMWILDGLKYNDVVVKTYSRQKGTLTWTLMETVEHHNRYLHYNWGWDGLYNGYFNAGIFNPITSSEYDNTTTISYNPGSFYINVHLIYI